MTVVLPVLVSEPVSLSPLYPWSEPLPGVTHCLGGQGSQGERGGSRYSVVRRNWDVKTHGDTIRHLWIDELMREGSWPHESRRVNRLSGAVSVSG